jgi:magnesium chelatase family protein
MLQEWRQYVGNELCRSTYLNPPCSVSNILILESVGAGKSMLTRQPTICLPAMPLTEAIETMRSHRVAGLTGDCTAFVTTRPFRAPHRTISDAGLIGGGPVPMPGDVSLAHHGVPFLDAWPGFRGHVLEVLRQPLDDRMVTITRVSPFASSVCRQTLPVHL